MATLIADNSAQYERDLRSGQKEWKRGKDANVKWSYGATSPRQVPLWSPPAPEFDEDVSFKARPVGKPSDAYGSSFEKARGNINKYARTTKRTRELSNRYVRHKVSAQEEIDEAASVSTRSVLDYLPGSPHRQMSNPMDQVLYSFDRNDSPGRPLTLEVFVKTTGRETEKFVEKEYEIVDGNGDMLKGRKARRNLRRGTAEGGKAADNELEIDEDGFELV